MTETLDRDMILRALDRLPQILGDRGSVHTHGQRLMRRPGSLAEVAAWSRARRDFWNHLADFLDQFYLELRLEMLEAEPPRLAGQIEDGDIADAYLAATAVSLARSLSMVPPSWARRPERKLRRPWFASSGPAIRATLLLESPAPFRERNLFVSENALTRA